MPKRFREARKLNKLKLIDAAKLLGVSQPTLSAWEGERKSPSIDALEKMAVLYGVSTDFLLGRSEAEHSPTPSQPLSPELLLLMNGKPVWSSDHGWMLVDSTCRHLILSDGSIQTFSDAGDLFIAPTLFSELFAFSEQPMQRDELFCQTQIWLEPISPDSDLRNELRGWYRIKGTFAENEYGNRFHIDTYGAKWLAFKNGPQK